MEGRLSGLQSRPELNGQAVRVCTDDALLSRIVVQLETGAKIKVRRESLTTASGTTYAAYSSALASIRRESDPRMRQVAEQMAAGDFDRATTAVAAYTLDPAQLDDAVGA